MTVRIHRQSSDAPADTSLADLIAERDMWDAWLDKAATWADSIVTMMRARQAACLAAIARHEQDRAAA